MEKLVKITAILLVCASIFSSCIGSSIDCKWEKQNYIEYWNYTVDSTYKHPKYKATYVIVTTKGKEIYFRPIQDIVYSVEKGGKILKQPYSKYAYYVNAFGDSTRSRIFSVSCDSIVENSYR